MPIIAMGSIWQVTICVLQRAHFTVGSAELTICGVTGREGHRSTRGWGERRREEQNSSLQLFCRYDKSCVYVCTHELGYTRTHRLGMRHQAHVREGE